MTHRRQAVAVATAGLLFGTTGTATLLADTHASPLSIAAARLLVGALGLLLIAGTRGWISLALLARRRQVWLMGMSVAAYMLLFFASVARAGAALASLVSISLAPVFTAVVARITGRAWPGTRWLLGTGLAVIGVSFLTWPQSITDDADRLSGALLAAGASAAYGLYTVIGSNLAQRGSAPSQTLAVSFSIGALVCSPFLMADWSWMATSRGLSLALWLGLATTTCAYLLFAYGLRDLQPGVVATLTLSEPAMATILGVAVLKEELSLRGWFGVSVVAAALTITALASNPRKSHLSL